MDDTLKDVDIQSFSFESDKVINEKPDSLDVQLDDDNFEDDDKPEDEVLPEEPEVPVEPEVPTMTVVKESERRVTKSTDPLNSQDVSGSNSSSTADAGTVSSTTMDESDSEKAEDDKVAGVGSGQKKNPDLESGVGASHLPKQKPAHRAVYQGTKRRKIRCCGHSMNDVVQCLCLFSPLIFGALSVLITIIFSITSLVIGSEGDCDKMGQKDPKAWLLVSGSFGFIILATLGMMKLLEDLGNARSHMNFCNWILGFVCYPLFKYGSWFIGFFIFIWQIVGSAWIYNYSHNGYNNCEKRVYTWMFFEVTFFWVVVVPCFLFIMAVKIFA